MGSKEKGVQAINPVTFNQHLQEAFDTLSKITNNIAAKKGLTHHQGWGETPLFVYETEQAREDKVLNEAQASEYRNAIFDNLPFPLFRLDGTIRATPEMTADGSQGKYHFRALVGDRSNSLHIMAAIDELYDDPDDSKLADSVLYPLWLFVLNLRYDEKEASYTYDSMAGVGGKWVPSELLGGTKHVNRLCSAIISSVAVFLHDAMGSATHIATVRPNRQGKSVEWIKARTHYTLITHGHPANSRTVRQGDRVTVDEAKELTRMAHNRRAHYRVLKSERYKAAKGQRIFIRATWIGPKSWQDQGGRQIYQIHT